ncbi:MAG: hypothetical protein Q7T89_19915 [Anaerolineales bacterium]|nr:hypothetical protein [Anaerolineales bacterium]
MFGFGFNNGVKRFTHFFVVMVSPVLATESTEKKRVFTGFFSKISVRLLPCGLWLITTALAGVARESAICVRVQYIQIITVQQIKQSSPPRLIMIRACMKFCGDKKQEAQYNDTLTD